MSTTHFAKFAEAIADLTDTLTNLHKQYPIVKDMPREVVEYSGILLSCRNAIARDAQRFYVPEGADIIEGAKTIPFIKLPYDCIAVLDEVGLYDDIKDKNTFKETTWKISIGFTDNYKIFQGFSMEGDEWAVLSVVKDKLTNRWACSAGVVICKQLGLEVSVRAANYLVSKSIYRPTEDDPFKVEREFYQDIHAIANLCTMLSLHNVKSRTMLPPEKLQKKRIRHGGKPLLSYKVLVVDGEEWHDTGRHGTTGGSVRSHMRRGHIRQLHASERRVWVRSTLVHGKTPGFVSKDYRIKT